MKHQVVAPRRVVEEKTLFCAVNTTNRNDTFEIEAINEIQAQFLLLEKIGYKIEEIVQCCFYLVDLDDEQQRTKLASDTHETAIEEALKICKWQIGESVFLTSKDPEGLTEFVPE